MRFSLSPRLLLEGYARVRCKAEIEGFYREIADDVLSTISPFQASVLDGGRGAGVRPELYLTCGVVLSLLLLSLPYL
ncbi:hypothetical protein SK128_016734 [Halocaridina rubra]|uniref:Uncharacterized protein n=1 Tax=Halocaridina rubra TaxID=373956 RepID=A0AAN9A3K8_HALRR